jgi:hypothetical protein
MIRSHEPEIDSGCESPLKRTRRTTTPGFFKGIVRQVDQITLLGNNKENCVGGTLLNINIYDTDAAVFLTHFLQLTGTFKASYLKSKPRSLWTTDK